MANCLKTFPIPKEELCSEPRRFVPVLVQTNRFRCVAFLDAGGKWRSYYRNTEIYGVTAWQEFGATAVTKGIAAEDEW